MAITNGYCTSDEAKSFRRLEVSDSIDDVEIDAAVNAASRIIDRNCGRSFFDAGSVSARVFTAGITHRITVDDFSTTTGLVVKVDTSGDGTYDQTWASTDYQTEPLNGVRDGVSGWPFYSLRAVGSYCFPVSSEALVEVTARWGWAAVPDEVKQACLMQTNRLLSRRKSPDGVSGFGDFGAVRVSRVDPDIDELLMPFKRQSIPGG